MKYYKELYLSTAEANCLWEMLECNILLYMLDVFSLCSVPIPVALNIIDNNVNVLQKTPYHFYVRKSRALSI